MHNLSTPLGAPTKVGNPGKIAHPYERTQRLELAEENTFRAVDGRSR